MNKNYSSEKYDKLQLDFIKLEYELWHKVIIFSAGLIGLPATLLPLDSISVNKNVLIVSWILFLINIATGFLSLRFFYRRTTKVLYNRSKLGLFKNIKENLDKPGALKLDFDDKDNLIISEEIKNDNVVRGTIGAKVKEFSEAIKNHNSKNSMIIFLETVFYFSFLLGLILLTVSVLSV